MRTFLVLLIFAGTAALVMMHPSEVVSQPSFNGTVAGCGSGGSCHTSTTGVMTTSANGLTVSINLTGASAGANVAGELVNGSGTVVAVNDLSTSNPFTLTAPSAGTYTVNAGYKAPSRQWQTAQVTLSLTGIEDVSSAGTANDFRLGQNYPNPFNPSSTIEYVLPRDAHVTMEVFNEQGERVQTLVSHQQSAGHHSVRFDATGLASGVYLYRMTADKSVISKKMVLLR